MKCVSIISIVVDCDGRTDNTSVLVSKISKFTFRVEAFNNLDILEAHLIIISYFHN